MPIGLLVAPRCLLGSEAWPLWNFGFANITRGQTLLPPEARGVATTGHIVLGQPVRSARSPFVATSARPTCGEQTAERKEVVLPSKTEVLFPAVHPADAAARRKPPVVANDTSSRKGGDYVLESSQRCQRTFARLVVRLSRLRRRWRDWGKAAEPHASLTTVPMPHQARCGDNRSSRNAYRKQQQQEHRQQQEQQPKKKWQEEEGREEGLEGLGE